MSLDSLINKVQTRTDDISDGQYFINILNEGVQKRNNANLRKPSTYYSPSSLGNCPRQLYYKRTDSPIDDKQDIETKNILKGETGTDRHERIQQLMIYINDELDYDFEWYDVRKFIEENELDYLDVVSYDGLEALIVDTRYHIRFRVDGIIKIKNKFYLLEIKTDDTFRWQNRTTISPYHTMQGISYSLSFGIDRVMYLYEERNNYQKKAIKVIESEKDKEKVVNKINKVEQHIEDETLPEKDLKSCRFCMYKTICKKDNNPLKGGQSELI
mgnify:CR=1 FL=1